MTDLEHTKVEFLRNFLKIEPFDKYTNPLPVEVESDHAPIYINTPFGVVGSENICNPNYLPYFSYNESFKNTHLNESEPYTSDGKLQPYLLEKVKRQSDRIINSLTSGETVVYVIVEGWKDFYNILSERAGDKIRLFYDETQTDTRKNITGIAVINDDKLITKFNIFKTQLSKIIPILTLTDTTINETVNIVGVHIPGCATQCPIEGMNDFAITIKNIFESKPGDYLLLGDFNTIPYTVYKFLIPVISPNFNLLFTPPYHTHVNPKGYCATYDFTLFISDKKRWDYSDIIDKDLPKHAKLLTESIDNARQYYVNKKVIQDDQLYIYKFGYKLENEKLVNDKLNNYKLENDNEKLNNFNDTVNHPKHYTMHPSGVEVITITESMNFCLGNAIKYIMRADYKGNRLEDLQKARWYIDREIERSE